MFLKTLKWPTLSLFSWISDWLLFLILVQLDFLSSIAFSIVLCFVVIKLFIIRTSKWKKIFLALGFPLSSFLLQINQASSTIGWLMPLLILLIVYPPKSWNDAPIFPTPKDALLGLNYILNLKNNSKILDFGSGAGHGIKAILQEWPKSYVFGVENSILLYLYTKIKYRKATIIFENMWDVHLSNFNVLYVFQRPETMTSIWKKAKKEMAPGSFVISLSFPIEDEEPIYKKELENHSVFIYKT